MGRRRRVRDDTAASDSSARVAWRGLIRPSSTHALSQKSVTTVYKSLGSKELTGGPTGVSNRDRLHALARTVRFLPLVYCLLFSLGNRVVPKFREVCKLERKVEYMFLFGDFIGKWYELRVAENVAC